jgi:type IV pilus assembly protein PilQ
MRYFSGKILCLCLISSCLLAPSKPTATTTSITINSNKLPLRSALLLLAKWQHHNIVISPEVNGWISLAFTHIDPAALLNYLLQINNLSMQRHGDIWYIAPIATLLRQNQLQTNWQRVLIANMPLRLAILQLHYLNVTTVANWLQSSPQHWLTKRGHMSIDSRTNTLFVQDIASNIVNLSKIVKTLDVPLKQVLIEARLASIDSNHENALGLSHANIIDTAITKDNNQQRFSLARLINNNLLDLKLAALEHQGYGELISKPSLFTANQQTAIIESGEDIPYQETSSSGATTVVFKKAVLSLRVTPQILPANKILLKIQINQDRPSSLSVLGVPAITTRRIITNVLLPNGYTVVLGGIYETSQQQNTASIPWINKLPVLSWLLQFTQRQQYKRELLVFITPRLISYAN